MKAIHLTALLFTLQPLFATEHYVSSDGMATWEQCTNIATPCSLPTANLNVQPGDTVYLRGGTYLGGTYGDSIKPKRSGTSIARIVYSNYNNEKVIVTEAKGINLTRISYVTVRGIDYYYVAGYFGMAYPESHHNIIEHCTFKEMSKYKWQAALIEAGAHHNTIRNCTFSRWGYQEEDGGPHRGTLLDILPESDYNLIENCRFMYSEHHVIGVMGSYNVFRNNYFQNFEWERNLEGYRGLYFTKESSIRNLFEGNRVAFTGVKGCGLRLETPHNIIRQNSFYYCQRPGITIYGNGEGTPDFNRIYNNTFYHTGYTTISYDGDSQKCAISFTSSYFVGTVVKNNIFHENKDRRSFGFSDVNPEEQIIENNWEEQGDPQFVDDETPLDPVDPRYPDFHLTPESSCIDVGGFLTTITSLSGSGSQFTVADAGYFMDGWGIIEGDVIQLEGNKMQVTITAVDYATNNITVESALAWTQGQGVALAYEGAKPDIGAFEDESGVLFANGFENGDTSAWSGTVE